MFKWIKAATIDWGIILSSFFAIFISNFNPFVFLVCWFLIGNRQHAIGVLGHEGTHGNICKNKTLNNLLTRLICLWPLGVPAEGYKRFHFAHHKLAGTKNDPELTHKWAIPQWEMPLKPLRILFLCFTDLVGGGLSHMIMILKQVWPVSIKDAMGPTLTWTVILSLCFWFNLLWVPVVWFFCIITTQFLFFRLRIFLEHVGIETNREEPTHRVEMNWWIIAIFAPHGIGYHWEHHKLPSVPFYELPEIRKVYSKPEVIGFWKHLNKLRNWKCVESPRM